MDKVDAIYVRQSVDKADSISIESQIDYCKYETRGNPYIVFADKGYSGKNTDRPQFQKMLQAIKQGKIGRVLCYKLDRCSRSILDFSNLMQELNQYNVEFISCTEKFDTSTPMGRAMLNICIVFAQLERETIQQRVYDAYHSRNIKGFYMGGRIPFGYQLTPHLLDGKKTACYEIAPDQAEIIMLIFQTYAKEKTSLGDIANMLNDADSRQNWTRTKISRILSNPIYVKADLHIFDYFRNKGVAIYNQAYDFIGKNGCYFYRKGNDKGELVLAPHKGIVSAQLWLQCRNKQETYPHRHCVTSIKNTYLAGKMKCLHCGYALTVSKTQRKNTVYRYLLCSMHNKSGGKCNGIHGVKADEIEKLISKEIIEKIRTFGIELTIWGAFSLEDKMLVVDLLIDKVMLSNAEIIIYWKI